MTVAIPPEKARFWRTAKRLRQEDVAKMLGISRVTYSNFETGQTEGMRAATMRKLANMVAEDRAPYSTTPEFCLLLADELAVLAAYLRSQEFTGQQKAEKFRSTMTHFHDHLDTYLAALQHIDRSHP